MDGSYASSFVAKMIFFTKGKGLHKDYLTIFELALRDAAISDLNLVSVAQYNATRMQNCNQGGRKKTFAARTDCFYSYSQVCY